MNSLSIIHLLRNVLIFLSILGAQPLCSMIVGAMEPWYKKLKSKEDVLLARSIEFAHRVRSLEDFVRDHIETGDWEVCDGQFALKDLLDKRASSEYITRLFLCGVRANIDSKVAGRTFFVIGDVLKMDFDQNSQHFPRKNLLSALALPSYQDASQEIILDCELPKIIKERKRQLRESISRVKTILLLAHRDKDLKQVRFIILAHLPEDIFCQELFNQVARYMAPVNEAAAHIPLEWVRSVVQAEDEHLRASLANEWAQPFANYRLLRAKECILQQEAFQRAQGKLRQIMWYQDTVVQSAQRMVDDLNPEGFVERHMPDCTKIIANLLLAKDPYDGFSEFKNSAES